jgi:hypothetical protein
MKPDTTLIAARILGPLLVLGGIMLITQPHRMMAALNGFLIDEAMILLAAFVTLTLGLVLVTLHLRWDSFTAGLISVIGLATVVRGGFLLLAPDLVREASLYIGNLPNLFPIAGCVIALIGVWLAYTGYIAGVLRVDTSR